MPQARSILALLVSMFLGRVARAEDGPSPLVFVQCIEHKFVMELKSAEDSPYQVTVTTQDGRKKSYFAEVGLSFSRENRFQAAKFEKKTSSTGEDVSELTVKDTLRKKSFVLVYSKPQDYDGGVETQFRLKSDPRTFNVWKGDSFTLPHQSQPVYRLAEVQAQSATVVLLSPDGKSGTLMVIQK
jgi:hypothetical protein